MSETDLNEQPRHEGKNRYRDLKLFSVFRFLSHRFECVACSSQYTALKVAADSLSLHTKCVFMKLVSVFLDFSAQADAKSARHFESLKFLFEEAEKNISKIFFSFIRGRVCD